METSYPQYMSMRRAGIRSEYMLTGITERIKTRQKNIIDELCRMVGHQLSAESSMSQQAEILARHCTEQGVSGWQSLISEFWSLEKVLN